MPVEVERDQGEVSVKVDIENATENKQEIVVPATKEDVGNGISHDGNNGNRNDKEDSDGSYEFITENDTVGSDSVGSDSVKPVDANVEKDPKEGDNMNSGEPKMVARSTADDVLGVFQDSQTLENSERERADDGPEEVAEIPKSEIEVPLVNSVEQQHPGNGHLEIGKKDKLESTEEVEQRQDSEVGPRDLTKNNTEEPASLQEKPVGKIESDSKTDVEGHQEDRTEGQEKSDLDVDVSEDLQHNEDIAKHAVDSDEGRESELVSAKVSPIDPEIGKKDKLESTEEVEQRQDSEVGPRDLTKNNTEEPASLQEKPVGKIESDSKTDVEGHQEDRTEGQEKSDLDVDVSEDLQHNEDIAKHAVDSDEGRESELVSAKVSPIDPNDGGLGLEQPTLTDPASTIDGSKSVNDCVGSESGAVSESISGENGDVPLTSETEKVNASRSDVLADSGTVEVAASEVSRDVPTETQTLTAVTLDSHPSDKHGVVENGNSQPESEAIQDLDFVKNSDVHSENGAADVSVSDGNMNTHPDSHDASEPACDHHGKQQVASEATEVLECHENVGAQVESKAVDGPASEERSDAVGVAEESVSEAISDGLSCTNQQEPKHDEISGVVEKLPSHMLQKDEADMNQKIQDESSAQPEEVTDVNEKDPPIEKAQENKNEGNLNIVADVCLNSAKVAEESSTEDLSGNVSHESAEALPTNINEPLCLLDSKIAVSELTVSSAEGPAGEMGTVATKSEAAESDKTCSEPHVASQIIEGSEINKHEEVSEMEEPDIKDRSVISAGDEVESDIKSLDSTNSPIVNNGGVKVDGEEDSREEKGEKNGAIATVVSETKTCAHDLESKQVTTTDSIHTGDKDAASGAAADCVDSQLAENRGGDAADKTDNKVASDCKIDEPQKDLASASTVEGSALDASEAHTVAAEIERKPFYFLPRVPRYDDENLAEQLKHAEAQVDQKTQSRDALRADIQKIRATCKDYDISYKVAMAEERSARKAMHSKRQEIEALQSVISRVKSAASVDDIDSRVHNMEHMIQHETLSLSEEKGFIREIKQLKQLRGQISSSMGTKDEVKQALDDREKTEERLKALRKELDLLRNDLSKAEAVSKAAKKKCDEEWEKQSKLQEQFRAADAVRQEAFAHLQNLKKQQREKNKYFFKYRDDSRAAGEMALKKDRTALQSLCSDQLENFMNMWNNDEEFRKYYVRCNTRSTIRRLGTLDGRSLGPDEEPPRITYATRTDKFKTSSDKAEKLETVPPVSAQEEKVVKYEGSKVENKGKAVAKLAEQKNQTTKPKKTVKADQAPAIVMELVSGKEEVEKSVEEEEAPKLSKEEEELIKKEEEKRKQKEAAKIKEQQRLEEIAKAKEAMERKKKREEKAKARAALKAQKEAEEREKEREKKLRKKERRKGVNTSEETTENPIETSEAVIETPREIEFPKTQTVEESQQSKKSHKQFLKQNKSKSIPLPLRNRASKRKLRQWMWIGLIVLVVLALFLLGNANLSFSPANLWFI